jgi:hypothetical protein
VQETRSFLLQTAPIAENKTTFPVFKEKKTTFIRNQEGKRQENTNKVIQ